MDFKEALNKIIDNAWIAKAALEDEHEGLFRHHVREIENTAHALRDAVERM